MHEGLNWDSQFSKVKGKMSGGLRSLRKLKNLISQSQLDHVYRAPVEGHLRYESYRVIRCRIEYLFVTA